MRGSRRALNILLSFLYFAGCFNFIISRFAKFTYSIMGEDVMMSFLYIYLELRSYSSYLLLYLKGEFLWQTFCA